MEAIHHIGAVRLRVVGSGNLDMTLYSLDTIRSESLPVVAMSSVNNVVPLVLANFNEQRIQLDGRVNAIDETYVISKIIIFTKPVATEYPA